ncbi:hypothetical protein EDB83DRAFT_2321797 [Lactarius deliciosus]|nr:hypothetical protein EDB83DRAFT_2321797 [Lactarius deliciosus]
MSGHAVIDIRNTYGCTFIGLIISIMLFGITTLQTKYGNRDQKALKLFIAVIFLLDALHASLCVYSIYWYLVLNFGNVEILQDNMWAMDAQIDVNTLVGYMVQLVATMPDEFTLLQPGFLSVGGSIVIPIIIVGDIRNCLLRPRIRVHRQRDCPPVPPYVPNRKIGPSPLPSAYSLTDWQPVTCIGMGSAVAADILIAVSMCWFLYHKRTGFARRVQFSPFTLQIWLSFREQNRFRDHDLDDLQYSVVFTDKFSMAPSAKYSIIFFWPMGKFYANSLLAMLNSRDYIRERSESTNNKSDTAFDLSSIRIVEQQSEGDKSTRRPTGTVSFTVHRSATTDFPQGRLDHDVESSTVENSKLVWSLHFSVATNLFCPSKEASIPSEIHDDGHMSDWSM